jgi:uncharacterized RDD family membrane protein YckC
VSAPSNGHDRKGLIGRVAGAVTGRVVETVDPDIVIEHIDVNAVVERMDVDALLQRIDLDALLGQVDVDAVLDRVDLDRLLDRVDVNAVLDRVDIDRLMNRVDMDALLRRVDVEAIVQRSGIPEIVAESTSHMAGSALDLARRQLVGLDVVADRLVDRAFRRTDEARHEGPPLLTERAPVGRKDRRSVSGHYTGPVSRAAAGALDVLAITTLYTVGYAGVSLLWNAFFGSSLSGDQRTPLAIAALALWAFSYVFVCLAVAGRTVGKAVVGIRVVRADGGPPSVRTVFWRTLVQPFSIILFLLGYLPVLLQREHRAMHDLAAGTAVVYDWGDRPAEMPGPLSEFLNRNRPGGVTPDPR